MMEWSLLCFALCLLYQILSGSCLSDISDSSHSVEHRFDYDAFEERALHLKGSEQSAQKDGDNNLNPEYAAEKKAGSPADLFGSNQHYSYPTTFLDVGRRFVPMYPYTEKKSAETVEESKFLKQKNENEELIPVKASPEKVLEVAMKSAIDQAKMSVNHSEAVNKEKEILRSGDYWNAVYVEDVDPNSVLRSYTKNRLLKEKQKRHSPSVPKLGTVRAKIMPGSKLYQLVSVLRQFSPKLLYVINKKQ